MTLLLCLDDSYLQACDAIVQQADGTHIILDQTVFYPQGGGQPSDTGTIARLSDKKTFTVTRVKKMDGIIVHETSEPGLLVGDCVHCDIDWQRRYKLMRMHTASHVLASVFHKETGALITGNQLGTDASHVDFSLETYDPDHITALVKRASDLLAQGHIVTARTMPREDALNISGMVKLANVLPPEVKELRIVTIGTVDEQADGGTHVRNTKECGSIKLLSIENKGKGRRRLYFALG
jgi:Ser-tRNA(Ala) deacylase AlaX